MFNLFKNITKNFKKNQKGAAMVEYIVVFPFVMLFIMFCLDLGFFTVGSSQTKETNNAITQIVSDQTRGYNGTLEDLETTYQMQIKSTIANTITSTKQLGNLQLFYDEDKKQLTTSAIMDLIEFGDQELCQEKFDEEIETICVYLTEDGTGKLSIVKSVIVSEYKPVADINKVFFDIAKADSVEVKDVATPNIWTTATTPQ